MSGCRMVSHKCRYPAKHAPALIQQDPLRKALLALQQWGTHVDMDMWTCGHVAGMSGQWGSKDHASI